MTAAPWPVPGERSVVVPLVVLTLTGFATVTAAIIGDGSVAVTVAPVLGGAMLWMIWVAPLRKTLLILIFFSLALDKPGDAENVWQSPLAPLGGMLIANLNKTVAISALTISLLLLLLGYLLVIRIRRSLFKPPISEPGSQPMAAPMIWALVVAFLTAAGLCAYGIASGGDVQMCKIQLQVFVPLLLIAYLFGASLRGARDYRALATVVVVAACVKAVMAVWIRHTLPATVSFGDMAGQMGYATTHGDSMLFACAVAILMSAFFEIPVRRNALSLVLIMPVLVAGMIANNRRLVWVQVGVSMLVLLTLNPRGRATRALIRTVVYALPLILVYGAVGWSSGSKVFAPVRILRSVGDAEVDRSTLYRDIENYNLVYTFRMSPFLGTGFGHPFEVPVQLDDISRNFKEWRFMPHNSILGLWAFTGAFGFTGLSSVPIIGLLLGAGSYHRARSPEARVAATVAIATILIFVIHCWGDIGFTEVKSMLLVGPALAVAGQLAVSTGAWPARRTQSLDASCLA